MADISNIFGFEQIRTKYIESLRLNLFSYPGLGDNPADPGNDGEKKEILEPSPGPVQQPGTEQDNKLLRPGTEQEYKPLKPEPEKKLLQPIGQQKIKELDHIKYSKGQSLRQVKALHQEPQHYQQSYHEEKTHLEQKPHKEQQSQSEQLPLPTVPTSIRAGDSPVQLKRAGASTQAPSPVHHYLPPPSPFPAPSFVPSAGFSGSPAFHVPTTAHYSAAPPPNPGPMSFIGNTLFNVATIRQNGNNPLPF